MKYKFFTSSSHTWDAMFQEIKSAQESIYLEMYIFNNDTELDFISLLKDKAKSGLKVKIILDSFGSSALSRESINKLIDSGVEIFFLSHFIHRMHKKILIIDEKIAFLGGVNIHNDAVNWRDLAVMIKGPLVNYIVRLFAKDYKYAGGVDVSLISKIKKIKISSKIEGWVFEHFPAMNKFRLKKIYKENFLRAKKEIILVTPYFVPKRFLVGLFHQTILRGVKVTILVPENTEYNILNKANYFYMARCVKLGVEFCLLPKMNHAKVLLIDGKEAMVGSQNLDFLSFNLNSEVGVWFQDKDSVLEIKEIVEKWQSESKIFKPQDYRLGFFDRIIAHILNFFVMLL